MMADIGKMKGHPGFLAYQGASVKPVKKEETQVADVEKAKSEVQKDTQYKDNKATGGEGSKG
jgi:hypothetical protein